MPDTAHIPVKQTPAVRQGPLFNVFGSLQREIDRLFEDFNPTSAAGRGGSDIKCRMDLAEIEGGLELTVELPGMEAKDIDVSISDGVLTVSGEKKFESERKDKNYQFIERGYGSFSRSISLPEGAKADKIEASMSKGVLKVVVPTPAKAEPKKIDVKSAA